jgi:hypothetical protein
MTTLKKFLKPDWRKIAITLIIPTIPFLILSIRDIRMLTILFIVYQLLFIPAISYGEPIVTYPNFLLILWIPIYIISCLIVWTYDKVKKK